MQSSTGQSFNLRNPFLFAGIIGIGMFLGYKMKSSLRYSDAAGSGKIDEIMSLVKANYVDSIATDSVESKAIDNLLMQLDPHSVYIPPQDRQEVDNSMDGEFEGIGIEYYIQKDTLVVTSVINGGPSAEAGLQSGDKIWKVNDSIVAGKKLSNEAITKNLRGASGTKVKVALLRTGKLVPEINITRGKIPMYSVDAAYMLNPNTGYIKINRFAATTYDEFLEKTKLLQKAGMQQLVLDLRDNPGGYLETAVQIVDEMIAGKKKIVYTKARDGKMETSYAGHTGLLETQKIAVLVDEGSASASEVVSGALQDYDRATIVGRRTFGKGLVQQQFDLSNGGALRLTIARYYIPSGRCIQKDYSKGIAAYDDEVESRYTHGELNSKDSIAPKDTTIYKTLAGRTVFGGGGITPDVFISAKTNQYSKNLSAVIGSGYITEVCTDFYNAQKQSLQQYKGANQFVTQFTVPETMVTSFLQLCKNDTINTAITALDKQFVKTRMKAQIAKLLFGAEAQYQVFNLQDDMVLAALAQLGKK